MVAHPERDQRLVENAELAALDRAPKVGFQLQLGAGLSVHGLVEWDVTAAAARLGLIERRVGVAHHVVRAFVTQRTEGASDTQARIELLALIFKRRRHRLLQFFAKGLDGPGAGHLVQQDRELVAAITSERVSLTHARLQPSAHLDQELVSREVAEAVVHVFEAVHVDEKHGEVLRILSVPGPVYQDPEPIDEQYSVRQAGQRVMEGFVQQLIFDGLLLADVALRAYESNGDALGVTHGHGASQHPDVLPVLTPDAVLAFEHGDLSLKMARDLCFQILHIVGMHQHEPLVGEADNVVLGVAQHRLPTGRVVDLLLAQVPVEDAIVGALGRQRITLLARAECFGGPVAFGDVPLNGHVTGQFA